MSRRFINQLRENETVVEVYQLTDRLLRPNKNGNLYLQFVISDKTGSMDGRFWNVSENVLSAYEPGDFVAVEGAIQRFQGALQFIAKKITKVSAEKQNLDDFARGAQVDVNRLVTRLREILATMTNPELKVLADCFLGDEEFMKDFCDRPGGVKLHHAMPGGLLDHTLSMMEVALAVSGIYSALLDRDILLMGVFLHDIGKIDELCNRGGFYYSDTGQILGHPFLGTQILQRKIAEAEKVLGAPFNQETAMLLTHMLISHHGTLENGSAKVPMTLEALALYFLDSLDAKLGEFSKYLFEDPNPESHWTSYIPGLDRKLYKRQNRPAQ